jgi:hypothetical protein
VLTINCNDGTSVPFFGIGHKARKTPRVMLDGNRLTRKKGTALWNRDKDIPFRSNAIG